MIQSTSSPSNSLTPARTRLNDGRTCNWLANRQGMYVSALAMRLQAILRFADSQTAAIISPPKPPVRLSSCTTVTAPVLFADSQTAAASQGDMERRSIRSTLMWAQRSVSTTFTQMGTVAPQDTSVRSEPRETKRALPIGASWRETFSGARCSRAFRQTLG